jgi:hypothetical protein
MFGILFLQGCIAVLKEKGDSMSTDTVSDIYKHWGSVSQSMLSPFSFSTAIQPCRNSIPNIYQYTYL